MIAICLSMIDVGDEDKFYKFYERYLKLVVFILNDILKNPSEAEEVAHDCFIRLARNFYKIKDIESKETENYVKVVAKNIGIDAYNKKKLMPETVDIDTLEDVEDFVCFEDSIIDKIGDEKVYKYIFSNIPDRYFDIVYLSVVMGFTPKEIGNVLGMSQDSVYKKIKRVRTIIKRMLDNREEE